MSLLRYALRSRVSTLVTRSSSNSSLKYWVLYLKPFKGGVTPSNSAVCRVSSYGIVHSHLSYSTTSVIRKTFEPDYLDSAGPVIPTYPPFNIQIRGYNFDILESFQSYVHNLAENMGVDVEDSWGVPAQTTKISTFYEGGTRVRDENNLNLYERNVQVVGLRSIDAPILFDYIRTCLPQGVYLSIHEHTQEHYEKRWIPDPFLNAIRTELKTDEEKMAEEKEKRAIKLETKQAKKQETLLKSLTDSTDKD